MSKTIIRLALTILVITAWSFISIGRAQQEQSSYIIFQDEPAAHALYDKMINTMRDADTLSYESFYRSDLRQCRYKVWMNKPNYFLLEAIMPEEITRVKLTESLSVTVNITGYIGLMVGRLTLLQKQTATLLTRTVMQRVT
jgi:hypothetical protein